MSLALTMARAWSCGEARCAAGAIAAPDLAQYRLREATLRGLRGTLVGQGVARWEDIPIRDGQDWAPLWAAQRAGERAFARSPVRFVERTGGSRGDRKEVPIVDGTLRAFHAYARRHVGDVVAHLRGLRSGTAWVLTSPPAQDAPTGGAPDDAAFLGRWAGWAWRRLTVDPLAGERPCAGTSWLDTVALGLARRPELEVMAVWHPSLVGLLLDRLAARTDDLPVALRGAAVRGDTEALWPSLRLVVAWGDAFAAAPFDRLAARFPHAVMQRRGLLATEGPVSVPLLGVAEPVPLWDVAVLEVETDDGVQPLHTLPPGVRGRLIASWPGGLVRTRLGDVVQTGPMHGAGPTLRLVGRDEGSVDLVGEKLDAAWVRDLLERALPGVEAALVGGVGDDGRAGYTLWTDAPVPHEAFLSVQQRLLAHTGYGTALGLGQLLPLDAAVDPCLVERKLLAGASDHRWGELKGRAVWLTSQTTARA